MKKQEKNKKRCDTEPHPNTHIKRKPINEFDYIGLFFSILDVYQEYSATALVCLRRLFYYAEVEGVDAEWVLTAFYFLKSMQRGNNQDGQELSRWTKGQR